MKSNNDDKKSQDKNKIDRNAKEGTNNNEIRKDTSEEKTKLLNLHGELVTGIMKAAGIIDGKVYNPASEDYLKNFTQYVVYNQLDRIIVRALDLIEGPEPLSPEQVEKLVTGCSNGLTDPSQYVTEARRKLEKGYYIVYLPGNFRQAYAQEINFFENGSDEDHYKFFRKIAGDPNRARAFFGEGKRLAEARKLIREKAPINEIFGKINNNSIYFVVMNELYPEGYPPKRKNNLEGVTRASQKKELTKNGVKYMEMVNERSVYTPQDLADVMKPFTKEGQRFGIIRKTSEIKKMKDEAVDSNDIGAKAGDGVTEKMIKEAGKRVIDWDLDLKFIELIEDIVNAEANAGKNAFYLPDVYKSIQNSKYARAGVKDVNTLRKEVKKMESLAGIIEEEDGKFTYYEIIERSIPAIKDITGNPDATVIAKFPYFEEIRRRASEIKKRAEAEQAKKYKKAVSKKGRAKKPDNFITKTAIANTPTINEPPKVRDICDRITKTVLTANNPNMKITTILEDCPKFIADIEGAKGTFRKNERYKRVFINVLATLAEPGKYKIIENFPDIEISSDKDFKTSFKLRDLTPDYINANMQKVKTLIPTENTIDRLVYRFRKNKTKNNKK